jgi:hypothetical protein
MPAIRYCYSNIGWYYTLEYLIPSDSESNMGRYYIHEYLTPSDSEGLDLMNIMPTHI